MFTLRIQLHFSLSTPPTLLNTRITKSIPIFKPGTKIKPNQNQQGILAQACTVVQDGNLEHQAQNNCSRSPAVNLMCNLKLILVGLLPISLTASLGQPSRLQHAGDPGSPGDPTCRKCHCGVQTLTHKPAPTLTCHAEQRPAHDFYFQSQGGLVQEGYPAFSKLCSLT